MTSKKENIYRQIQDAINNLPDNFSILEEQIDVELQLKYFNFSKELKNKFDAEYILNQKNNLFDSKTPIEEKKNLLALLASVNEVEAYRTIEKYSKSPDQELKEWSILALQESRMLMQSTLLDEQQVFISTGLGGQGQKLRYFVILRGKDFNKEFTATQKQIIESELKFHIQKYDGIFEEIEFEEGFAKALFLIPLKSDMQEMFRLYIEECNQYGNYLDEDVILTNVRKLEIKEIKEFLTHLDEDDQDEEINYNDEDEE